MAWNPLEFFKKKLTGGGGVATNAISRETLAAAVGAAKEGPRALQGMEQKGMLSKFFRYWKDPAFRGQIQAIAARMQADGVDLKDKGAVQAWIQSHEKEIASGNLDNGVSGAKPQTYVKPGPALRRNDPCGCGSGKKYKKCCADKADKDGATHKAAA